MDHTGNRDLATLHAPERNNYFYGKLLDDLHLQMEQDYFNRKRWLLNRLGLGTGVLCGLTVREQDGLIAVASGVAIDSHGREIIVPSDVLIDLWITFDVDGTRTDLARDREQQVWLCLSYVECQSEMVPVLVPHCGAGERSAAARIVESYRLVARTGPMSGRREMPRKDVCAALGTTATTAERIRALCGATLSAGCTTPHDDCVVLASVTMTAAGTIDQIDQCTNRQMVYGNAALFEMIVCLAARVDECCAKTPTPVPTPATVASLVYVSGDGQQAAVGTTVRAPLVVLALQNGVALPGATVEFFVKTGGGEVGATVGALTQQIGVQTDATGRASLPLWKLGPTPGPNVVIAAMASAIPGEVKFTAAAMTAEVPRDDTTLRVTSVEFLSARGKVLGSLDDGRLQATLRVDDKPAQIRFTFSASVDPGSLSTYAGGAGLPSGYSVTVVRATQTMNNVPANIAGVVLVDPARPEVAIYRPREPFAEGLHECMLHSGPNAPSVTDTIGRLLDGDPVALPSGDGADGGSFVFAFSIA